MQSLNQKCTQK